MEQTYPSDVSREQFEKIRDILESSRKRTAPRTVDLYDVLCGILYVLKGGIQWRMLPKDYPKWQLCYYYFRVWSEKNENGDPSVIERVLKKIGRSDAYIRGPGSENDVHYYRCAECQKLRHSGTKRL